MTSRRVFHVALVVAALAAPIRLVAQLDEEQRVRQSLTIFREIMTAPDSAIPTSVLAMAEGIAVFPGAIEDVVAGGGQPGSGILSARVDGTRGWSAPAFVIVTGAGVGGARIGGGVDDLVLIIVNRRTLQDVVNKNFTLGTSTGVAPGPIGPDASALTDAQKRARILSYSRARGVFAGISLNGASIRADRDGNQRFYGRRLRTGDIVFRAMAGGTGLVSDWREVLAQYAK